MANPIIENLSRYLSNTFVLYTKTLNFHWNVTGIQFHSLHEMFEEQYTDLATTLDETAERIRALGAIAPGQMSTFLEIATLSEGDENSSAESMLRQLLSDHEQMVAELEMLANCDDVATADFATVRTATHQKTAWMLRASLGAPVTHN